MPAAQRRAFVQRQINDRRVEGLMDARGAQIGPDTHYFRDIGDDGYPIYWIDFGSSSNAAMQLKRLVSSSELIISQIDVLDLFMQIDGDTDDIPLKMVRISSESFEALCEIEALRSGDTQCLVDGQLSRSSTEWGTWQLYDVLEHDALRGTASIENLGNATVETFVRLNANRRSIVIVVDLYDRDGPVEEAALVEGLLDGFVSQGVDLVDTINDQFPEQFAVESLELRLGDTYATCQREDLRAGDRSCLDPPAPSPSPSEPPRSAAQIELATRAILKLAEMPRGFATLDLTSDDEPTLLPIELCPGIPRPRVSHPGVVFVEADYSAGSFGPFAGVSLEGYDSHEEARAAFDVRRSAYISCPDGYYSGGSGEFVDSTVTEMSLGGADFDVEDAFAFRFESGSDVRSIWLLVDNWIVAAKILTVGPGEPDAPDAFELVVQQVERLRDELSAG